MGTRLSKGVLIPYTPVADNVRPPSGPGWRLRPKDPGGPGNQESEWGAVGLPVGWQRGVSSSGRAFT